MCACVQLYRCVGLHADLCMQMYACIRTHQKPLLSVSPQARYHRAVSFRLHALSCRQNQVKGTFMRPKKLGWTVKPSSSNQPFPRSNMYVRCPRRNTNVENKLEHFLVAWCEISASHTWSAWLYRFDLEASAPCDWSDSCMYASRFWGLVARFSVCCGETTAGNHE